jgi:hypothetical protein
VKSFASPPEAVIKVFAALFVVLGICKSSDWKEIKTYLGKSKIRDSISEATRAFYIGLHNLSPAEVRDASTVVTNYPYETVKRVSAAASAIVPVLTNICAVYNYASNEINQH